ncbi:hypothetical protein BKA67DRAFT_259650 [Truncatella angustata]|uniref:Uncharacterized protein n=1 Tax=Truncatella angustata TaxID=152316 RepID=A0A9P8UJQ9_9PEZI|nr:uncharacterized protein BKA67DRAFT_259650 [Truncatella angustata]KAH6653755.1 hypothetical protein BKA67DRAFT_259650 [Truncatella angustata]
MATNANLPAGAFITSLGGKRLQATTTQAAAPAIPPAVAPVLTDTTTTAAAVTTTAAPPPPPPPLQQQTLISTTGSTSVAEIVSSASAVETSAAIAPTSEVGTSIIADLTSATAGNAALLTTIGTGTQATPGQAEATDSSSEPTATSAVSDDSGISTKTTIAVVGGVVGGVVAIALIAFLIWFWQKRIRQKRRSTLLTPLGPESGFGSAREKIPYSNSRNSIGPTTVSEKLKALVGSNVRKIRGRFGGHSPSGSVNLNRGNSQYMEGMTHSRDNSADMGGSAKDRLLGFFGRSDDKPGRGGLKDGPSTGRGMKGAKARPGSQPDFLTLLSMDDKQLSAQTNNGRTSMSNPRRSQSAGSNDHFLGSLNLNFDAANPFSDANIMDRESAKPRPLVITNPDNPFSDANAVQQPVAAKQTGPTTYVQNIRRSRGTSVGGAMTRPPSTDAPSMWRESGTSVASFATRRNKFRSDPFDLDRPELLSSSVGAQVPLPATRNSRTGSLRGSGVPLPPNPAHTRAESLSSSKYSSGVVSLDQWSDPGPDVGPASSRYESPTPTGERKGDGRRRSGASQGSQGSVGKAY